MDFKLSIDSRNDLDITNGRLSFVTGTAAVAQRLRMKLQSFLGESVYNLLGGTPWLKIGDQESNDTFYIFENTNDPVGNARFILLETIRSTDGVDSVIDLNITFDESSRVATLTGKAKADSGETFGFGVSVTP